MPPKKTPTSSLPVIELLVKRVFYRTLAGIRKMGSGGVSPETSTTHCSPATRLPFDVVEIIIAYLRYDTHSLRACTLTCYSWYIAAVPHLHHTLTTSIYSWDRKTRWPNPIRYTHMLGLLPLVKEFRVRERYDELSPKRFNCCILRQFSALTNVQKLEIGRLDIPSFMPRIQRYFRHFLPTVQSLVLGEPEGSRRQIIYFIGLFQNLQDLEFYDRLGFREGPGGDSTLIPAFVPPLRGWLRLLHFNDADLLKDMIDLFGGIRFRYMNLYQVHGMRSLLHACATTLECVVFDLTDSPAESSLQDFDLSRNKLLRTLQVSAFPVNHPSSDGSPDTASRFLKHVLSTVTSSEFFMITVLYEDKNFHDIELWYLDRPPVIRKRSQAERAKEVLRHRRIFRVIREAHKVRDFQLKLCASVWGSAGEGPVQILEEAIAEERAENGFDDFLYDPFVEYSPRRSHYNGH